MRLRLFLVAAIALAPAMPAAAQTSCKLEDAVYAERQNGYELNFRKGKPWEMSGMTEAVFDLVMPDGRRLWGTIASNMGTSRDVGRLFWGCPPPSADGPDPTEEEYETCKQWEGLVYAINKGEPQLMASDQGLAPERLLLTDLGRKIRYSMVSSPGEEPWDVFDFKRCRE
jgi:hypothetical protein